jgi:hypothetical protein
MFGVRGGANAVAKAYQFWSARSAGGAQPAGAESAQGVEAHRAAAPVETLQATRAAASANRAAAAYVTAGSYSTSGAAGAAETHAARGKSAAFVAGQGDVVVDIEASESGYDNAIYYSTDGFRTRHRIGIDNQTQSVNLGSFAPGTKIEFGIENGEGEFFKTGAGALNGDGLRHARIERHADGTRISFEDLHGGGDRDFNDAIIDVRSTPVHGTGAAGVEAKASSAAPADGAAASAASDGDTTAQTA